MKSAADRVLAFRARMQGEAVSPATKRCLDAVGGIDSESMNQFITRTGQIVLLELQVKSYLDGQGVPTTQYPSYMSFARSIWSLKMAGYTAAGATTIFRTEAVARAAVWVTRGLDIAKLNAIIVLVSAP
jgi:hypothetical protein